MIVKSDRIEHPSSSSKFRQALLGCVLISTLALVACETTTTSSDVIRIDREQGSEQNIASLTSVITANPNDPEGYNVRGSAYGKAGQFNSALEDFNKAISINPRFHQAYANRALIYRNINQPVKAANDYNQAIRINPQYDAAYIGRGNLYRQAGRTSEAFADFNKAIDLGTTDPRAFHNRGDRKSVV